MLQRW